MSDAPAERATTSSRETQPTMDTVPGGKAPENVRPPANPAAERLAGLAAALAGRYSVEREVGRGGMATVYLADDLRHRRRVAVKVLYPELREALGAERFLREIEVTAGLHHPHILPLHDSGEVAGYLYYVMPLVEGESLRERLNRERQLPIDDAVRIASHVANALDYAHRRGIVHRDLKPENILIQDGEALVADFGIARAVQRAGDADTLTGTGVTLGTPQYMSPEQAAGERELDARTDIYALGCVLYEMLAGTPPFTAATAHGVFAKVMTAAPRSLLGERRTVPPHIEAAVMKALEKNPADRFSTAAQFANVLAAPPAVAHLMTGDAARLETHAPSRARSARFSRRDVAWASIAVALAALAYGAASGRRESSADEQLPIAFKQVIPDSEAVAGSPRPLAISPDGRTIVYTGAAGPGRRMLYLRRLDELEAHVIPGSERAISPFISPDGRWIAFSVDGGLLKKVPIDGGPVTTMIESLGIDGASWAPNDVILGSGDGRLVQVAINGGKTAPLTVVDTARGERAHFTPRLLPDGKTVAFRITMSGTTEQNRIGLVSLDESARPAPHVMLEGRGGTPIGYVDGLLIAGNPDGTLLALPVDLQDKVARGPAVQVLDKVVFSRGVAAALSNNGSLFYMSGGGRARLTLLDERGGVMGGREEPLRYQYPRFSPNGRQVAVSIVPPEAIGGDIWVYDPSSGDVLSRVTHNGSSARPEWTPDGKRIAFIKGSGERPGEAWWVPADQSSPETRLYASPTDSLGIHEFVFAPNTNLAVLRTGRGAPRWNDIWTLSLDSAKSDGERRTPLLTQALTSEVMPRVSHDGRWLAYASNETGQYEVYLRAFPGPDGHVQLSSEGGSEPVWIGAQRVAYRSGNQFIAVSFTAGSSPGASGVTITDKQVLFEDRYSSSLPLVIPAQYDFDPVRRRFVVLRPVLEDRELVVITNWMTEVRKRVAATRE